MASQVEITHRLVRTLRYNSACFTLISTRYELVVKRRVTMYRCLCSVCVFWMTFCVKKTSFLHLFRCPIHCLFSTSLSPLTSTVGWLWAHSCLTKVLCRPYCPSLYLSMIYKLVPHMQSHSLFLHCHINKFIVLAFRYIVFSLVPFPSKSCLFKSRTASYITCGVRVLALCHRGIGGSAPALKSPLMTDKDIIKVTQRSKRRPCSATVQHRAITHTVYCRCVCAEVWGCLMQFCSLAAPSGSERKLSDSYIAIWKIKNKNRVHLIDFFFEIKDFFWLGIHF